MRKKFVSVCLTICILMMNLVGCSASTKDVPSVEDKTNVVQQDSIQPEDEDMLLLDGAPDIMFEHKWVNRGGIYGVGVFKSLFISDETFTDVKPDLAKSYKVSEDGLTLEIELRDDVTWHDGEKFDSEDVRFSIMGALRTSLVNGIYTGAFTSIEGAQDYKDKKTEELKGLIIDGNKITLKLINPVGNLLNVLAQFVILPEHLLRDADIVELHNNPFWEKPIGTGPYMFTDVVMGNYAIMEAYDGYYGKQPKIKKIKFQKLTDTISAAKSGQIDYFSTNDINIINEVSKIDGYKMYPMDIYFMRYLIFNLDSLEGVNEKIKDVRIREAMMYALDRETIVKELFPQLGATTETFVPAGFPEYNDSLKTYEYNPEKAKQLLNEAGYDFNNVLKLRYYYGDQATLDLMDTIAYYWGEVGIKVETSKFQGDATTEIYEVRDHDIVYKGLSAFGFEEAYGEMDSQSPIMQKLVNDDIYDELVDELRKTTDVAERTQIIKNLQEIDQECLYRIPLYTMKNVIFVNENRLKTAGVYGNEWYNYDRGLEDWELIH